MIDQQPDLKDDDTQPVVSKSHEHFNPVVLTDTVGALFLGLISLILMGIVAGLLVYIRKLEKIINGNGQA